MPFRNETDIIGTHRVNDAANQLVDSVLYLVNNEVPVSDQVREIRIAVAEQVKQLVNSVREHVVQTSAQALPPTFSPGEIAQNFGITHDKVLGWIHSGKLEAYDVSQDQQGRPRYRIDADAIARFKAARMPAPPPKASARRKKPRMEGVIEFF